MVLIIFALILVGSGFIAERVFSLISHSRNGNSISTGLVFSLLIFITNTLGMYLLKDMINFSILQKYMDVVAYTTKYTFLSILVGIIFAIIGGIIVRLSFNRKHNGST